MFKRKSNNGGSNNGDPNKGDAKQVFSNRPISPFSVETLESRRLLSASWGFGGGFGGGHRGQTIEFSQAPAAVQAGLTSLASTDKVAAPTSTQEVYLGNKNGVETYSIEETGTGTDTRLTVDVNGKPVTAPTTSTTTFGAITNTAVTGEISKIATALGLTAPASTQTVHVTTNSAGTSIYTVGLTASTSSTTTGSSSGEYVRHVRISVDSDGNPVGNENIPFSALPATIQNGLIAHEPSGVSLTSASTQKVKVRTIDGVNTYTMVFNSTGTRTSITVNDAGTLVSLPSTSTTTFADVPSKASAELQTLANDDGVTGTISSTQTVRVSTEPSGTTVYTVRLTDSSGNAVRISVDENGNPTVPPSDSLGGGGFGLGGLGFGGIDFSGGGFRGGFGLGGGGIGRLFGRGR